MTFIGFTIWFVISAILIGAAVWSANILLSQKRSWEAFAKKHGLQYDRGKFMSSPRVSGHIDGLKVELFSAERQALDVRERRMLTAIEITQAPGWIDGAAVGTTEMRPFINALGALHTYTPESEGWDSTLTMHVRDDAVMKAWLTPERLKHIAAMVGTKNSDNLLIFDAQQAIVRVETRDPLTDGDKLEKSVMRLIKLMKSIAAA